MADTSVAITAGSGTLIDTRTEATNGNHRQVVVLGDPSVNAGVAPVDATNGLSVSVTNASVAVTAASLPLPTGAATAAKQPALGTAGSASADVITVQGITSMTPLSVSTSPNTSGGCSQTHIVSAATTNATSVKGSAGQLYGIDVFNNAAYPVYVKFYNKATAPTVGTDTVLRAFGVQAGVGRRAEFVNGIAFATGIAMAITKGITDADTTAVALSDCVVDVDWK